MRGYTELPALRRDKTANFVCTHPLEFVRDGFCQRCGTPMTKVYLAARYGRREELSGYMQQLEALGGVRVTSRWLTKDTYVTDDQRESDQHRALAQSIAIEDLEDVQAADYVISFTEKPREISTRGGRHVEFGIGVALGKRSILIGPLEHVFHDLPGVVRYASFDELLQEWSRDEAN